MVRPAAPVSPATARAQPTHSGWTGRGVPSAGQPRRPYTGGAGSTAPPHRQHGPVPSSTPASRPSCTASTSPESPSAIPAVYTDGAHAPPAAAPRVGVGAGVRDLLVDLPASIALGVGVGGTDLTSLVEERSPAGADSARRCAAAPALAHPWRRRMSSAASESPARGRPPIVVARAHRSARPRHEEAH